MFSHICQYFFVMQDKCLFEDILRSAIANSKCIRINIMKYWSIHNVHSQLKLCSDGGICVKLAFLVLWYVHIVM